MAWTRTQMTELLISWRDDPSYDLNTVSDDLSPALEAGLIGYQRAYDLTQDAEQAVVDAHERVHQLRVELAAAERQVELLTLARTASRRLEGEAEASVLALCAPDAEVA